MLHVYANLDTDVVKVCQRTWGQDDASCLTQRVAFVSCGQMVLYSVLFFGKNIKNLIKKNVSFKFNRSFLRYWLFSSTKDWWCFCPNWSHKQTWNNKELYWPLLVSSSKYNVMRRREVLRLDHVDRVKALGQCRHTVIIWRCSVLIKHCIQEPYTMFLSPSGSWITDKETIFIFSYFLPLLNFMVIFYAAVFACMACYLDFLIFGPLSW